MRPSFLLRFALIGCLSLALVGALVSLFFLPPSPADARVRGLPRDGETETLTPSPSPTEGEGSPTVTTTLSLTPTLTQTATITSTATATATSSTTVTMTVTVTLTPTATPTGIQSYIVGLPLLMVAHDVKCFENPDGTPSADYHALYAVAMASAMDGWAAGQDGTILHWNGCSWRRASSPTANTLRGLVMMSSTDGWAVGDQGTILHWDGQAWLVVGSPTDMTLWAVAGRTTDDVWAVGDAGTVVHWDGREWVKITSPIPSDHLPSDHHLHAVAVLSPADVWVGGLGVLAHWNGVTWSIDPSVPPVLTLVIHDIRSISMVSSTIGWAVGNVALRQGCHFCGGYDLFAYGLQWNGHTWQTILDTPWNPSGSSQTGPPPLRGVSPLSDTDAWVVGDSIVEHWDGHRWTVLSFRWGVTYNAVAYALPGEVWVVGESGGAGIIQRFSLASLPTPTPTP